MRIINTSREAEWLETSIGVQDHAPKLVELQPLGDLARGGVDDEPRAPEMIRDDPVAPAKKSFSGSFSLAATSMEPETWALGQMLKM